ncbi:MAG: class I SAM-dependent RNA methyltransferase, partial [Anaerolineae bacterium]|nr:class I SAM-dependent RNA methyltransferase [Anaerolineae bacterium]
MSETIIEVQLETMANGGSALGRSGEQVVFIPYTIPGERVQARVLRQKGRTLFAEGVTLLESSADRVFPACEHFGPARCGGCQWQHIQYEAQLLLKQDVLSDQLERIAGISDPPVQPFIPSPEVWGYNQQMTFYPAADGQLGLPAAKDDSVFAVQECLVLHPDLLALKDALDLEQFAGLEAITLVRGSDGGLMCVLRMQG